MTDIEGGDYDSTNTMEDELEDKLRGWTIGGNWDEVEKLYESNVKFSTISINKSRGTALHVAVNDDNINVVRSLVGSILLHRNAVALEKKNDKGDTPLHLAASRGFKEICECIIGKNGERKDLIYIDNNNGETPLFLASLSWEKQTFLYLFSFERVYKIDNDGQKYYSYSKDLIRSNGDSILHCAIRREFFDLALIIIHKYPGLGAIPNKYDFTPLKLLATRSSAFKSGCKMIWWKKILYHSSENKVEKHKVLQGHQHINISMPSDREILPKNYATCLWFLKFAYIYILGLSGVGVEEVRKMKQKHKWCRQLLNLFMENPYDSYLGAGAKPPRNVSGTDFITFFNPNQGKNHSEKTKISETLKRETAILTAARNGIVEIVTELITKIPSSIYEVNLENKNILLLAVENRRTIVVESLRKQLEECNKKAIFDNLIQGVDNKDNTVLHLAATRSDRDWHISGAALQMMWHIKWFQYTKGLVPEHFIVRTNKMDKTAGEIFKKSHTPLVKNGSAWLKDTSESCSVVAALLAGVSFATSSTVPGGNKSDTGEPALEGKPAFDAFALSSVIGLCFSVTALIMFLSILTSRKEAKDFRIDLPRKLLLGLSSLFLSIVAMFAAFCSGHFFLIDQKYKHIVFLIYTVTCFPVTLYAVAQLPLYIDLLRGIVTKIPKTSDKGEDL
ncbi:uncharacterized protein [Cicer arietinum]|uniref:Uncharacterized protein LOC101496412 isoform X4 n=1 Tax=Cicer arietinum TaxID=3827 RepID=A0A1S2Z4N4_CICAR|nr:uncharacterized protein LOC101496412 isoform X4 [Cicer arietinum]